ncbi:MAG: hypothetical protein ACYT04_59405, partial [Nostoc sp.]
ILCPYFVNSSRDLLNAMRHRNSSKSLLTLTTTSRSVKSDRSLVKAIAFLEYIHNIGKYQDIA